MQQSSVRKQGDSQFICKLQDMMEKHPLILSWSEDGAELVVNNLTAMQQEVLPQYFRHRNFGSFVRQLNMYNFHKICRSNNMINFKNDIFQKGNEANYHLIKRKKKNKEEENVVYQFQKQYEPILQNITNDNRLAPSVKGLVKNLMQFKYIAVENQKKIKRSLDTIVKELKESRSKKINSIVTEIKQNTLQQLEMNMRLSNSIDFYMEENILKEKKMISYNSIPLLDENKTINDIMLQAKNCNFHSINSLLNIPSKRDCLIQNYDEDNQSISFQRDLDD